MNQQRIRWSLELQQFLEPKNSTLSGAFARCIVNQDHTGLSLKNGEESLRPFLCGGGVFKEGDLSHTPSDFRPALRRGLAPQGGEDGLCRCGTDLPLVHPARLVTRLRWQPAVRAQYHGACRPQVLH